jgi:hypothetical protein
VAAQDAPVASLRIENNSDEPLDLVLECYGSDHWLLPGETFVVWTVGSLEGGPWPGTTHGNEPFQAGYSVLINVDFSEKTWSRRGRSVVRRTQEPYWLSSLGTAGKSDYPGRRAAGPRSRPSRTSMSVTPVMDGSRLNQITSSPSRCS